MTKTIAKFALIYVILSLLFSPILLLLDLFFIAFPLWSLASGMYFVCYYYNKRAYTFYIDQRAVSIKKSWIFGTYKREVTLDQIRDFHVNQGILARLFDCGSLLFSTTTGLEVGYGHSVAGAGTAVSVGGGFGRSSPLLMRGRMNTFWDVPSPGGVRDLLVKKLAEWREVFQQRRIAVSLEKIAEKPEAPYTSLVTELERLKALLDDGAITEEEYEKAKKKLLA